MTRTANFIRARMRAKVGNTLEVAEVERVRKRRVVTVCARGTKSVTTFRRVALEDP
jgi:hypothetical protein